MRLFCTSALVLLMAAGSVYGQVRLGASAPDFSLFDRQGKEHWLTDYRGRNVVLRFSDEPVAAGKSCSCHGGTPAASQATAKGGSLTVIDIVARFGPNRMDDLALLDADNQVAKTYGLTGPGTVLRAGVVHIGPDGLIRSIRRGGDVASLGDLDLQMSDWRANLGSRIPNFALPTTDGASADVLEPQTRLNMILVFDGGRESHAWSNAVEEILQHKEVSARCLGIRVDAASNYHGKMVVASDTANEVVPHLAPTGYPYLVIADQSGHVIYRSQLGAMPDRVRFLHEVTTALLSGRPAPAVPPLIRNADKIRL